MILYDYLFIGVVFYAVMCALRHSSFKNADVASVLRGALFGVFLWPVALIYLVFGNHKKDE